MRNESLTRNETRVASLMAEGHNNQQIAALIGLAANSVRNMVSVINSKLDAENRMDAILKWRIQAGKSSYDGLGVQ